MTSVLASSIHIGDSRVQQDCVWVSSDARRAIVCDGHGPRGHEFAHAVCEFQSRSTIFEPVELFRATNTYLHTILGPELVTTIGGTSCSALTVEPDGTLRVANIGDSAVRVWDTMETSIPMSVDHCPTNFLEFDRIREAGGMCVFADNTQRYRKGKQPVFVQRNTPFFEFNEQGGYHSKNCRREWAAYFEIPQPYRDVDGYYRTYRLAMTRAFGDWELVPYGLITEPSVTILLPTEGVRAIVMASDGLWDVLQDEEIGKLVRDPRFLDSRNAEGASLALLDVALEAGTKMFGSNRDNVSIVVGYIG